jgi:hypothetical protein
MLERKEETSSVIEDLLEWLFSHFFFFFFFFLIGIASISLFKCVPFQVGFFSYISLVFARTSRT